MLPFQCTDKREQGAYSVGLRTRGLALPTKPIPGTRFRFARRTRASGVERLIWDLFSRAWWSADTIEMGPAFAWSEVSENVTRSRSPVVHSRQWAWDPSQPPLPHHSDRGTSHAHAPRTRYAPHRFPKAIARAHVLDCMEYPGHGYRPMPTAYGRGACLLDMRAAPDPFDRTSAWLLMPLGYVRACPALHVASEAPCPAVWSMRRATFFARATTGHATPTSRRASPARRYFRHVRAPTALHP